jgi:hypothetical protein
MLGLAQAAAAGQQRERCQFLLINPTPLLLVVVAVREDQVLAQVLLYRVVAD